jgi:hypothetical protein
MPVWWAAKGVIINRSKPSLFVIANAAILFLDCFTAFAMTNMRLFSGRHYIFCFK